MSDTVKKDLIPASPRTDPMASSRLPDSIFEAKDPTKGPSVEVGENYEKTVSISSPGPDYSGLILRHENYITPSPDKDYRFCTNDNRRVGRNKAKGWQNVKENGKDIVVGNMTLCERPKTLGDKFRAAKIETALRQAHRASADVVASSHPGLSGKERKETVTRSEM